MHECLKAFTCKKQTELGMLNPCAMPCRPQDYSQKEISDAHKTEQKVSESNKSQMNSKTDTNILYENVIKHATEYKQRMAAGYTIKKDFLNLTSIA